MVDESASVGTSNFNVMKSFMSLLVGTLDIDSGNTRVGVVTYSSTVGTTINLNDHSTLVTLQQAIYSLPYRALGTDTGTALAYVRTVMLTAAAGDRPDVPNVVVLFIDGQSNNVSASRVSIKFAELYMSLVELEIYYIMTRKTR